MSLTIGQLENPLEGVFAYRVPLFRRRLRVVLVYRVNQMDRTIEMVDMWSEEE